ncbi:hypothetical protein AGMMS50230_10320 [Spirochaetia bacterium]|nr:hypothetical protein AGMMS50230_10320 [Spirochaetia bacterium]
MAADSSGTLQLQANLEPNMAALIRSFGSLAGGSGGASSAPLLDAAALNRSLRAAPGVTNAALRNSGPERIEGPVAVSRIGDLLAAGVNRFVRYEGPAGSTPGKLTIHLDRNIGPRLLSQLSPETADYLSALMAPLATGEALSKTDYLALVESVYGKAITGEIGTSRITAAITFPGTVKSVKGGSFSGREARFNLSLLDILVVEQALDYEVTWVPL